VRAVAHRVRRHVLRSLRVRHVGWLRAFVIALGLCICAPMTLAEAQDRSGSQHSKRKKKTTGTSRARTRTKQSARSKAEPSPEPAATPVKENARKERSSDTAASRAADAAAQGVDSEVVKEGDTSVKVMRFSGLELEGRLKSPQLLYFVNRVRAEFDRPKLPHRSFMPELHRSTQRDPL